MASLAWFSMSKQMGHSSSGFASVGTSSELEFGCGHRILGSVRRVNLAGRSWWGEGQWVVEVRLILSRVKCYTRAKYSA
jgi:hypothetical protein